MVAHFLAKERAAGSNPVSRSMFSIFSKITRKDIISKKTENEEPGLYFYLVFPIAFAFLITFMGARILNIVAPNSWYINLSVGHVHHFAYGIFVLAVSGYLALIFDGPQAKYLISLLHGFALGLTFDEYWFWIRLSDDDPARWSYDGFLIVMGLFFIIISAKRGIKMLKILWPFR